MTITQIIPIGSKQIKDSKTETVNARELHEFLEVRRDFSNWIKGRIKTYGFRENQDFVRVFDNFIKRETGATIKEVFAKTGENPNGGRPAIEYHLTIDMAKELSMVERTQKGRQARQYFIECEKRYYQKSLYSRQKVSERIDSLVSEIETIKKQLAPPKNIRQYNDNPIAAFCNDRCEYIQGGFIPKDIVYSIYQGYCYTNGEYAVHKSRFFQHLYRCAEFIRPVTCIVSGKPLYGVTGLNLQEVQHDL